MEPHHDSFSFQRQESKASYVSLTLPLRSAFDPTLVREAVQASTGLTVLTGLTVFAITTIAMSIAITRVSANAWRDFVRDADLTPFVLGEDGLRFVDDTPRVLYRSPETQIAVFYDPPGDLAEEYDIRPTVLVLTGDDVVTYASGERVDNVNSRRQVSWAQTFQQLKTHPDIASLVNDAGEIEVAPDDISETIPTEVTMTVFLVAMVIFGMLQFVIGGVIVALNAGMMQDVLARKLVGTEIGYGEALRVGIFGLVGPTLYWFAACSFLGRSTGIGVTMIMLSPVVYVVWLLYQVSQTPIPETESDGTSA